MNQIVSVKNNNFESLNNHFEKLFQQFIFINVLGQDLIYLFPKHDNYHKDVFGSNLLFRLINGLKTDFALRLSMFLDSDEDYNLPSFVRRLIVNYKKAHWRDSIELAELQEYEQKIEELINTNEFRTIRYLRNKLYAHLDKHVENTDLSTNQDSVMTLVNELKVIVHEIGLKVFNTDYKMEVFHGDLDHNIISTLSNYYELQDRLFEMKDNSIDWNIDGREIEKWISRY